MTKCNSCGGELEYVALPRTVYADPNKKSDNFVVFRMCTRCGRGHKPDLEKAGVPYLDEVRKKK